MICDEMRNVCSYHFCCFVALWLFSTVAYCFKITILLLRFLASIGERPMAINSSRLPNDMKAHASEVLH